MFCFWSTKCDFLEETAQGRHIVKYSLSTKQGWEVSTTLHSYYKVLMQTDVSVNTADVAPPIPMLTGRKGQIAYEAESDSGSDEEQSLLASGGTVLPAGQNARRLLPAPYSPLLTTALATTGPRRACYHLHPAVAS